MTTLKIRKLGRKLFAVSIATLYFFWSVLAIHAYSFNEIVPDVRQPANLSGGSACPVPARQWIAPGSIAVQWSTILGTSPQTILTSSQAPAAVTAEIQAVIQQSENVWAGVAATSMASNTFTTPAQVATANICGADGVNSICFDQEDMGFTPGVLAFTRVITADAINTQLGNSVSTQVGQILDADIYFNPGDTSVSFATPSALAANPTSYDLESLLVHEFGHLLGFGHSAVFAAIMFPFAAAPGTFSGQRPTAQQPDAPLGDDDRAGLRTLYPNPTDTTYIGSIQGRVLPANPLSLPTAPTGVNGIFGAHVVAVNASTGAVAAGTLAGWSCTSPGPAQFDGTYL
ncbi:MAG TPA: matrixin family metalloprotease, partial [Candidatus Acidoferrum sp.]|nr:matrixin family metalloprotease [Candidatus Acidoferrum sp.]